MRLWLRATRKPRTSSSTRSSEAHHQLAPEAELRPSPLLQCFGAGLRQSGDQERHRNRRIAQYRYSLRVLRDSAPGLSLFKTSPGGCAAFREVQPDLQSVLVTSNRLLDDRSGYLGLLHEA